MEMAEAESGGPFGEISAVILVRDSDDLGHHGE